MACVSTILALVSGSVEQELVAEGAQDDLVELALDEFVAVHLVHLVLALAHGTLTAKTSGSVQWPLAYILLDCRHIERAM